jgi:hypothetical protein
MKRRRFRYIITYTTVLILYLTDRFGIRLRIDADFHLGGPMVRHMPPTQVPVNNWPCQDCHRGYLDHLTAHR